MKNNVSIIAIVVGALLVLGIAAFFASSGKRTVPQTIQPTPITKNQPIHIQTFYLDETGEPLTDKNIDESIARNEARLSGTIDQINEDLLLINQLHSAL
jgi:hypothetical protein